MLGNKPVDFGQAYLGWHTDLLPAHHPQTKPGESCPCFRRQSMEAPTAALARRLDCRVRTSCRSNWANFRIWKRCFFVSLVLNSVHNTIVTCKLKLPSFLIHRDHFNDLLVRQREAVLRLAQLSATRTLVRVPEFAESRLSLTCALICDWRRHPIANQSWLQMPALLDFSISFVVNDT